MTKIVWTPPGSQMGLGTIELQRQPQAQLTPAAYRWSLAKRINKLVAAEDPDWARELLARVDLEERLSLPDDLGQVGHVLVECSHWLRERASYPTEPVPTPLEHDADDDLEDDNLEAFLGTLYHVSW